MAKNIYDLNKEFISSIISEFDQGMAIIYEGTIELCNSNFTRILGIDHSLIYERKIEKIIPGFDLSIHKNKEFFLQKYQKTIKIKTLLLNNDMNEPLLFLIVSEINQEKENTIFLNEAFKTILENIDEGVLVVDSEGKLIYCNKVQLRFDGQDFKDIVGCYSWDVYNLSKDESTLYKCLIQEKPTEKYVHYYISKTGDYIRVTGNNFPVKLEGKTVGAVAIDRNLRKSEEMVKKIVKLQKQLSEIQSDNNSTNDLDYTDKKRFFSFKDIVGESDAIRMSINQAENAARSDSAVFLYGETGTGKEMFAQSIHNASVRSSNQLISINCAAIPENLLEGIIFGTVKGAFTGSTDRKGLFEEANGGTLFLDEINSMPIHLQSKLLRAIEEMKIMRLGGKDEITVDVRIISSCNISPEVAVSQNLIRSDLYFRLAVIAVEIPPLRERKDDIRILVDLFIRRFNNKLGKNVWEISPEIFRRIEQYDWPGNIRQLKHWVESALTMIPEDDAILTEKYAPRVYNFFVPSENDMSLNRNDNRVKKSRGEVFEEIRDQEIVQIIQMLKQHGGNITKTAKELGLSRQGLQYRMKKLGIK